MSRSVTHGPVAASPAGARTLATRLRGHAEQRPDAVAFRYKRFGVWEETTWHQYWDRAQDVSCALAALGIGPGDRVAVHSENRPEWLYADLATVALRGITVGLYPTNPSVEVEHILGHSQASIVIVEDQEQADKALAVADRLSELKTIVYVEPRGLRSYRDPRLMSWSELVVLGQREREREPGTVERHMADATPDDVLALIYTSGTTGPPKGAMISVANAEFAIEAHIERAGLVTPKIDANDVLISYLPLCHGAERILTEWTNLATGCVVNFAESIETIQTDLRDVQPTVFLGVPRIWEKVVAGIEISIANATPFKRMTYRFWERVSQQLAERLCERGGSHTWGTRLVYLIGWLFVYRALKERIGMARCRFALSGSAPIAPEVLKYLMGIGVPIYEVYGMTENTATATRNRPGHIRIGTVGEPYDGIEVSLNPMTGEVLTRHGGNFVGYWRDEEATMSTFTDDGWLKTGDVGEWVHDTHLKITGRIKDIIITSGGKNISPAEIENSLKASQYIREAVVIGDGRKFLTALIGIELETVGDWASRKNLPYTTYRDLTEKPQVRDLIEREVQATNGRFARVENIRKFKLIPKELDHDDGELTATQKVRRSAIAEMFSREIEEMYGDRSGVSA